MSNEKAATLTDSFLSIFAEVRSGEGVGALLLGLNVFILLEAYYILKTVREALILSEGGAEVKAYWSAAQAAMLLLIIPAYGLLASKVNRERLITFVSIFFASHLAIFYFLARAGVHVGIPFFLWIGIFNLLVIAQFWAFANDLYNKDQGQRLLPVVGIGSSLGAWSGISPCRPAASGIRSIRTHVDWRRIAVALCSGQPPGETLSRSIFQSGSHCCRETVGSGRRV
jgi:AAA family ATP:ADP antiporter